MKYPILAAALLTAGCAMNAATHDPQWVVTVPGHYKDMAACTFDELRKKDATLNTAVNERRQMATVWSTVAITGSTPRELTFTQTMPNEVRVEFQTTYWVDLA